MSTMARVMSLVRSGLRSPGLVLDALRDPQRVRTALLRKPQQELDDFLEGVLGVTKPEFAAGAQDALDWVNKSFALKAAFSSRRGREMKFDRWQLALYAYIRKTRPELVVETGVFDGHSSTMMLLALQRNGAGRLISIDLPGESAEVESTDRMRNRELPVGCQPGWVVPQELRDRWTLILEDARTALPRVMAAERRVDLFLHDSLHTFDHMLWEYGVAWPRIPVGGSLWSDDVGWNDAFFRFAISKGCKYGHNYRTGICLKTHAD